MHHKKGTEELEKKFIVSAKMYHYGQYK